MNVRKRGAKLFFKDIPDPQRFGIGEIKDGKLIGIEEKPKQPKSNFACTGLYMYDNQVFDVIKTLKPSQRGEFEITDVNNFYIKQGTATHEILEGFWSDAGTFKTLFESSEFMRKKELSEEKNR